MRVLRRRRRVASGGTAGLPEVVPAELQGTVPAEGIAGLEGGLGMVRGLPDPDEPGAE